MSHASSLINVAVIGAGNQGAQIAFRCAIHGKVVSLFDVSDSALKSAVSKFERWRERYISAGRLNSTQAEQALRHVHLKTALADAVQEADLVIEAVHENLELKRQVWAQVDASAPAKTLLATNSSSIRSSLIATATNRRDRTFNVNFANPVDDDLVEVMWNTDTSDATKSAAKTFLQSLGNVVLETRHEIQGFSFNRVWRAIKKECLFLFGNGYSNPEDIDRAFILALGSKIGPFALMDIIGLDVIRDIEMSYYRETGNETDKPPQALLDMIERGHLGVKSGKGFYTYPNPAYEQPNWLKSSATESPKEEQK